MFEVYFVMLQKEKTHFSVLHTELDRNKVNHPDALVSIYYQYQCIDLPNSNLQTVVERKGDFLLFKHFTQGAHVGGFGFVFVLD